MLQRSILLLLLTCLTAGLSAETHDSVFFVKKIYTSGNKKTKEYIIHRELSFSEGDTLHNLVSHAEFSKRQLLNTFLFNDVRIEFQDSLAYVILKERWYIWPFPVLDQADRNFNQWWLSKDPKRLIYGVNLAVYNVAGRYHTMMLDLLNGYTKLARVSYKVPYFNKKLSWGLDFQTTYSANREVWLFTKDNKLQFFNDNNRQLIQRAFGELRFVNRKNFFTYHIPYAGYSWEEVEDTVRRAGSQPQFFIDSASYQREIYTGYQFTHDKRDYKGYPLNGHLLKADVNLSYLGTQKKELFYHLYTSYSHYKRLSKKWFAAAHASGYYYSNNSPPYTRMQALGYDRNYLRGYELNVIDGNAYVLSKAELKYKLFSKKYKMPGSIRGYESADLSVYITGFYDAAYVANPYNRVGDIYNNNLINSYVNGYGAGLNFLLFYDYLMRLEYSSNQWGFSRFYISFTNSM